ncbi:MAG TPA: DUF1761 domain-containing protein [Terracidiphilus sp.]|nr:DUF1761 domain-containing protein [Terracidiphilus sp.]
MHDMRIRLNYWAILVAVIACFALEAAWYTVFMNTWLNGIGRTMAWLTSSGMNEYVQYATALVMTAVIATAISCVTQLTGPQTTGRGIKVGALLWLGFILPTWATEYVFEVRPWSLLFVNAGFWLVGTLLMGAIVGGWKKKTAAKETPVTAGAAN